MTVTVEQVAAELREIDAVLTSEKSDKWRSPGEKALAHIVRSLLGVYAADYIVDRPKPVEDKDGAISYSKRAYKEMTIAEWSALHHIVFDIPKHDKGATIRIGVDNHYARNVAKIEIVGDNAVIHTRFERMTISTFKTRPKTEWKDIDAETKKLVPVLDKDNQPIIESLPPQTKETHVIGRMTIPLAALAGLLNEIGRDSFGGSVAEDYVPAVIGEALSNVLGAAGIHPMQERFVRAMAAMPRMIAMSAGPRSGRGMRGGIGPQVDDGVLEYAPDMRDMMMMLSEDYAMLGYGRGKPIPCRVFLQPDDKGRMEIIAEPYPASEIKENQLERGRRTSWSEWNVQDTDFVRSLVPQPAT